MYFVFNSGFTVKNFNIDKSMGTGRQVFDADHGKRFPVMLVAWTMAIV